MDDMLHRLSSEPLKRLAPTICEIRLGAMPAFEITPSNYQDDGSILFHIHGGSFVFGGGPGVLLMATLNATCSGRRVISIDYSLAPHMRWPAILEDIVLAWQTMIDERRPRAVGIVGESAGGCLALTTTLALRERNLRMPDALVVQSPVVDLAQTGDTNVTLKAADNLNSAFVTAGFRAFADEATFGNPLVSPIYADFAPGFPPTLIQAGTREFVLSDSVRLHRALRQAGISSRLEIYEGMPHVFQMSMSDVPEGCEAWKEVGDFWASELNRPT
jgi:acetyl esterase/lipase